jgi:ribosomal protein L17
MHQVGGTELIDRTMARARTTGTKIDFSTVRATLDVLGVLGLLAGGCFAVMQYLSAKEDARVSRTMEYIDRYEQGEVATARRAINESLKPFLSQFQELEAEKAVSAEVKRDLVFSIMESSQKQATEQRVNQFAKAYDPLIERGRASLQERRDLIRSSVEATPSQDIAGNVDRLVDFFEGLRTCVAEKVCDERVAVGYFSSAEAPELWNNFWPYAELRRKNNARYAAGLEWFARPHGKKRV